MNPVDDVLASIHPPYIITLAVFMSLGVVFFMNWYLATEGKFQKENTNTY